MKEVRYMISDAAKKISVEPHVLRYWEEELEVEIPRNEMGHRYYREEDIQMMQGVKYLKERGFQLKSIKILLPDAQKVMQLPHRRLLELRDRLELAVSREELRLQREKELQNCSAEEAEEAEKAEQAGGKTKEEAEKLAELDMGNISSEEKSEAGKEEAQRAQTAPENGTEPAENPAVLERPDTGMAQTEQKEKNGKNRGREGSRKEMKNETRKAAGERMKNRMDRQEEKTVVSASQGEQIEIAPGGQAARLVEMWQSKKTDKKPRKRNEASQRHPAAVQVDFEGHTQQADFEPGIPSESMQSSADPALSDAGLYPPAQVLTESENAVVQADFEPRTQPEALQDGQAEVQASIRINAVRMQQFKGIMNEIITDAMRENNRELAGSITSSVSKEMEYHMRKREMMLEEHFKQLDRTLREYQLGQKQAAVARECGGRRESRFFRKNGKVRI